MRYTSTMEQPEKALYCVREAEPECAYGLICLCEILKGQRSVSVVAWSEMECITEQD